MKCLYGLVRRFRDRLRKICSDVLFKTPGRFAVMLPHADRPFVSRSPFFYQDDSRTFFVAPRGKYVGGPGGPACQEQDELKTTPLELPESSRTGDAVLRSNTVLSARSTAAIAIRLAGVLGSQVLPLREFLSPIRLPADRTTQSSRHRRNTEAGSEQEPPASRPVSTFAAAANRAIS